MKHRSERVEIQILEEMLEVLEAIAASLTQLVALLEGPIQATTGELSAMATTATLTFVDDTGAPAAPPSGDGSGLVVTFASDNPAVTLGVAVAGTDSATAPITGTDAFNLSATVANTSGAALLDDDGVTAFVQPSPVSVPASTPPVPQAVTAVLSAE